MKYHIIYADPPWSYSDKKTGGTRQSNFGAAKHYPCMPLSEIKSLGVSSIREDNSVCFLWVTFPLLKEGIEVLESWGFKYKTNAFSWVKLNKDGTPFFGVGAYTKSNVEVCLFGTRGRVGRLIKGRSFDPKEKLAVVSNHVSSLVMEARPNKSPDGKYHSRKPVEVYERIEKLFGPVSRVELFARTPREGWDALGNHLDGRDIRKTLQAV